MPRRKTRIPVTLGWEDLKGRRIRAYLRESSERQAGADRFGPDVQRAGIERVCAKYHLSEPEHYYFDKASGRSADQRPELMLAYDQRADYDVLIFFHTSRSFRNREDAATWKPKFRRAGVTLVFAGQEIISGDPRTKTTEFIHEFTDEQRSDEQAMFIRSSLRQKFERGLVNGTVPIGYVRHYGPKGDPELGVLEIVSDERRTVREVWDLALTGRYSDADIATRLNLEVDEDHAPRHRSGSGARLTPSSVRIILTTLTYTGVTVWHPGTPEEEVRPARHEPIVTPEEFDRMRVIRSERARQPGVRSSRGRIYPFSRRAFCYYCNRPYAGDAGGKGGYMRMRHAFGECSNPRTVSESLLERQLGALLQNRFALPESWRADVARAISTPQASIVEPSTSAQPRQRLEKALARLQEMFKWGDLSQSEYLRQRDELNSALRKLTRDAPKPLIDDVEGISRAAELLKDMGALWSHPGVTPESRRQFVQEAFDEIELDEMGIRTVTPAAAFRPLGAVAEVGVSGAGDRIRTGDPLLGKHSLCPRPP